MMPEVFLRVSSISQAQDGHHILPTLRSKLNTCSEDMTAISSDWGLPEAAGGKLSVSVVKAFEAKSASDFGIIPFSRHCLKSSVSLNDFGSLASVASSRMLKTWRHPMQQNT